MCWKHALELARGAGLQIRIDWRAVPVLQGVRELAAAGHVTGASGRNWAGYGEGIELPASFSPAEQALLTDPQTSGGLLATCAPSAVAEVLAIFRRHGFDDAAVIGECHAASGAASLVIA